MSEGEWDRTHPAYPIYPKRLQDLILSAKQARAVVIENCLRRGEVGTLVAPPKSHKSYAVEELIFAHATESQWLETLEVQNHGGKVMLIDYELDEAELTERLCEIAIDMRIDPLEDIDDVVDIHNLRLNPVDLSTIDRLFCKVQPGEYSLIIVDPLYRMWPAGLSENDNVGVAAAYAQIMQLANKLDAAWLNVHHTSKGAQGAKAVTDVGAGAGAQSRAVDCHLVMREHDDDETVVIESAVRSFAPIPPFALRWKHPRWHPVEDVNPADLKGAGKSTERRMKKRDGETDAKLLGILADWKSKTDMEKESEFGEGRINRSLSRLTKAGLLECRQENRRGNPTKVYRKKSNA